MLYRYLALVQKLEKLHIMVSGSDGLTTLENHIPDLPEDKVWSVVLELDAGYGRSRLCFIVILHSMDILSVPDSLWINLFSTVHKDQDSET